MTNCNVEPCGVQQELVELIRSRIRDDGPQPFAWFMEQALYHPQHGYYSSGRATIGRKGDYFTNVSVGPLFGRLLAAQFAEIWERMGRPGRRGDIDNFTIVEQGAHDGRFALDVLEAAQRDQPAFFEALRYRIIEPFPIWQDRQLKTLEGQAPLATPKHREGGSRPKTPRTTQRSSLHGFRDKVEWSESMKPFTGVHFSNELLDAMPAGTKFVGLEGDKFVLLDPPPDFHAKSAVAEWIDDVCSNLVRGFVLIVDYGFRGEDFREVIQARAQHRHLDSPFDEIGDADITMHINWSEITERARANGLSVAGFTDQHHFLTGVISHCQLGRGGSPEPPAGDWGQSPLPATAKDKRALQTLLHPEMLGRAFQVLLLGKDVELSQSLSGFRFARR